MTKYSFLILSMIFASGLRAQNTSLTIMDGIIFYDGYASVVSEPTQPDVIRFRNDLYSKKITDEQLAQIGTTLTVNVTISALCDNYDRIGNINVAMVPKGSNTYDPSAVKKIELGRFITPFMNKNVSPTSVPYTFQVNNLARVFKAQSISAEFDFWLEFEVFGVPYAANNEVSGCSGRNDVFKGKVEFVTNQPVSGWSPATVIEDLYFKADFNRYQAGASDAIGTTVKTLTFTVDEILYDAKLYLITSNHGANSGGEEYVRRNHFVTFDGTEVLTYKPGGKSCEPYRVYNTQGNGIYGSSPRTEAQWTAWNNWCPGDVIPIREISLGTLSAGNHTFKISVPDAQFNGNQGNIPVSLYLQGSKTNVLGVEQIQNRRLNVFPNPAKNNVSVESDVAVKLIEIVDLSGKTLFSTEQSNFDISSLSPGSYLIKAKLEDGSAVIQQFVKH